MAKYFLLKSTKNRNTAIPARLFADPKDLKLISSPIGWKIFSEMITPVCPMDISKKLGIHEQKVYYYTKKLKAAGLIEEVKTEQRHGTLARFYQARDRAFAIKFPGDSGDEIDISSPIHSTLLKPFVSHGKLNARIIVGSPDPHGPWKARGSDSCCAIDFALFIGAFTSGRQVPNYMLDIEVHESNLKDNLILFGGPAVNMITYKVNSMFPIRFNIEKQFDIESTLSGETYKDDEFGLISLIDNPWNKKNKILLLAGKRFQGTRASVIAWVKHLDKIMKGNRFKRSVKSRVVRGYDMNGDGVIDSVEFLE